MQSKQRRLALWKYIRVQGDAEGVYADLVARYTKPHRAYHTPAHIEHCLEELKQVRHLVANPDAVEMALWYHDAIYDTRAKDNKEKSAKLALATLSGDFGRLVATYDK